MKFRTLAVVLVASGCANQPADNGQASASSVAATDTTTTQPLARALQVLARDDRASFDVRLDGRSARPVHLAGRSVPVVRGDVTPSVATLAFVTRFHDIFQIDRPIEHLVSTKVQSDALGMTHARFQQVERGVPVRGSEMMAHYDRDGALRSLDSTYTYDLGAVDLTAKLDADQAVALAKRDFEALAQVSTSEVDTKPTLVIDVPRDGEKHAPLLAFHLDLRSPEDPTVWMDYAIDAKTGAVVRKFNKVMALAGSGTGVLGDTKTLQVTQDGGTVSLLDLTRTPNGIATYDAHNKGLQAGGVLVPGSANLPGDLITAPSETGPWDPEAVDAHFYAGITYDFYKKYFGRLGIDGKDAKLISSVHVLKKWNNAQWALFDGNQMLYGDGDGEILKPTSGELDVVAHELTHGVTFGTSGLSYVGESGALNEAISDVFGSLVEFDYTQDPIKCWLMGRDLLLGQYEGKTMRNYIHPHDSMSNQPAHMSEYKQPTDGNTLLDFGGVHSNSGIVTNAFFLMTMGGVNDVSKVAVPAGIGRAKAAQVWYRTNVHYLTSSAGFAAAADANLSAATDLGLSENQKNIIKCAWIAVGVVKGDCAEISPEAPDPDPTADGGAGSGATGGGGATGSGDPAAGGGELSADGGADGTQGASGASPSDGGESGCSASPSLGGSATAAAGLFVVALAALVRRKRRS